MGNSSGLVAGRGSSESNSIFTRFRPRRASTYAPYKIVDFKIATTSTGAIKVPLDVTVDIKVTDAQHFHSTYYLIGMQIHFLESPFNGPFWFITPNIETNSSLVKPTSLSGGIKRYHKIFNASSNQGMENAPEYYRRNKKLSVIPILSIGMFEQLKNHGFPSGYIISPQAVTLGSNGRMLDLTKNCNNSYWKCLSKIKKMSFDYPYRN